MKIRILGLGLITAFFGSISFAGECIPQKEMAEIAASFSQFKQLAKKDFCYDGSETSNLLASLMFMRKTAFQAAMPPSQDELFSGRFSQSWFKYFAGRINNMNVQSSCPKGVGAYVYGFGNTMYVCPMLLSDSFSALDRASVFMHEARHIDGYPHTTCSSGPRKDLDGACDERISDGGSYAVTVETYAQLAKYATDLHPALRSYSKLSAVTYADETFDVPARVNRAPQLLIMDKSQNLFAVDLTNGNQIIALGQAPALGHLVPRASHLILIPDDKSITAKYMFTNNEGEIAQAAGEAIIEYNKQVPSERAKLVDLHISGQWVAKVYTDKITFTCDPRSAVSSTLPFKNGSSALAIQYLNGYSRSSEIAHVMTSDGSLFEFGCPRRQATLKPSSIKLDQKYKRTYKIGNSVYALTVDGYLYEINGSKVTAIKTGVDGKIHEIAPKQSYQFFDQSTAN
jgi:hypothetical protein